MIGPAGEPEGFCNEPFPDWTQAEVRGRLGETYPLVIGGEEVGTDDVFESVNPAKPDEVVGRACQAGRRAWRR